jgi:hypothetical protein
MCPILNLIEKLHTQTSITLIATSILNKPYKEHKIEAKTKKNQTKNSPLVAQEMAV